MKKTLPKFTEFELKYRTEVNKIIKFQRLVEEKYGPMTLFCSGPDDYYTHASTKKFKRFRHATYPPGCKKEITTKTKPDGAKNNISRIEKNLDVSRNDDELIRHTIQDDGYVYDFSIWKMCTIYKLNDVTLVWYVVVDTTPGAKYSEDHFVEIELDEDLSSSLTEEEAWQIVERYERLLAPIGVNAHKRIRKSLYELYTRNK
jgi:adenylate cyclase class IV